MGRLVEIWAPERLGTGFRWLLASSWVSNLGDGVVRSAGPLLVASQTHNPFLVSLAFSLQMLPGCCSACSPVPWPTDWTDGSW
ncbi:MAG: major facilitator superfamily 1 [Frankiales bacterium]|nr:major facilitator superfamily 1 [Frankiales bacterium]